MVVVPDPDTLVVHIGFDSSNYGQELAFEVARRSLVRKATKPVEVRQLVRRTLVARGQFRRVENSGVTEFTYTRFLVPFLNGFGDCWALFCDSDFLFTDDVWKIFESVELDPGKAVYCVQHDVKETGAFKMNGLPQAVYPRKNWSSFLLFNCGHAACRKLTPENVAEMSPAWLHRLQWAADEEIGALPHSFNYLVDHYHDMDYGNLPLAIHWTDGGPWHPGYERAEFGDLWLAYLSLEEFEKMLVERGELGRAMESSSDANKIT